ncbi:MAG: hypothetical protein K0Q72_1677 [Armatimonadetes bacterium]|jgi:hypothetical protein|nr:hypothetical protein [Armatimonadota bacterium]
MKSLICLTGGTAVLIAISLASHPEVPVTASGEPDEATAVARSSAPLPQINHDPAPLLRVEPHAEAFPSPPSPVDRPARRNVRRLTGLGLPG